MKQITWLLVTLIVATVMVTGCAKKSAVDTSKLESSFSSADAASKSAAGKAAEAIKAGDYASAMASLQKLAGDAKLTPEQKQAISDVMAQVQKELGGMVDKVSKDANKATENLKKSLPQ